MATRTDSSPAFRTSQDSSCSRVCRIVQCAHGERTIQGRGLEPCCGKRRMRIVAARRDRGPDGHPRRAKNAQSSTHPANHPSEHDKAETCAEEGCRMTLFDGQPLTFAEHSLDNMTAKEIDELHRQYHVDRHHAELPAVSVYLGSARERSAVGSWRRCRERSPGSWQGHARRLEGRRRKPSQALRDASTHGAARHAETGSNHSARLRSVRLTRRKYGKVSNGPGQSE
jgi:hypothetical protein